MLEAMGRDSHKRTLESRDSHLKPSPTQQEREGTALVVPAFTSPLSLLRSLTGFLHFQGAVLDKEALRKNLPA